MIRATRIATPRSCPRTSVAASQPRHPPDRPRPLRRAPPGAAVPAGPAGGGFAPGGGRGRARVPPAAGFGGWPGGGGGRPPPARGLPPAPPRLLTALTVPAVAVAAIGAHSAAL